ncbi:X antigen family member 1 isoform X1 [Homo sapiens]|uniref:X antigen family member 1 isoform X1 n=1 Tax=Homo sapiens TaxID=9606 RepID=UPI0003EAFF0E|nr:X antigen family member 1 isoform X1 [Homo sapiens]XP_016885237.1 X antigen family member 1 isoform X1 [Homo sapiens]XP_054183593.1 X antigen family member 1 isoform X2 [Homo sapiens]XP_054183594.1 X antigen family member 1 isoform X1 [Homo sapiens]|eukprot:XP_016885235.1 X antigen family member 1 isoform X1 [Homo sapiens]
MRCHAHGPSCLVTAITREEGGPRSGGAQAKLGCCWGYPSPRSTWNPDRRFWTPQTGPGEGRHERHTQTQNHTASPRSPVMESPKKKNQQLKVGILHLGSRQKKIRIQLRSQVLGREMRDMEGDLQELHQSNTGDKSGFGFRRQGEDNT